MNRFLLALVALCFVGCGNHNSSTPVSYLTCYTDENNVIFVDIDLPYGYTGVFSEVTVPSFGEIVSVSATYNLGVFAPGEYVFELELVRVGPPPRGAFAKNLDGLVDICSITIEVLPVDPPVIDPPPVDPPIIDPPPVLPPAWGLHKILICKKGVSKFLPYPAASNLIKKGKATLGVCPDEDLSVEEQISTKQVNGEWQTVFGFPQRGGNKPPRVEETCADENTNQVFVLLPAQLPSTFAVQYQPAFEVAGEAFSALDRAFDAWEGAAGLNVFDFTYKAGSSLSVVRDGVNAIGWRRFVGPGGDFLAAAFIWDNGTDVLEVDIFFNLKHKWRINAIIEPGSTLCGEQFDIQAVGTHEIGHMLGLGHVPGTSDATMAPTAAKGELAKQTLTPGDVAGAITATN